MAMDWNTLRSLPALLSHLSHCSLHFTPWHVLAHASSLQIFHKEAHPGMSAAGRSKEGLSLFGIFNKAKVVSSLVSSIDLPPLPFRVIPSLFTILQCLLADCRWGPTAATMVPAAHAIH